MNVKFDKKNTCMWILYALRTLHYAHYSYHYLLRNNP